MADAKKVECDSNMRMHANYTNKDQEKRDIKIGDTMGDTMVSPILMRGNLNICKYAYAWAVAEYHICPKFLNFGKFIQKFSRNLKIYQTV